MDWSEKCLGILHIEYLHVGVMMMEWGFPSVQKHLGCDIQAGIHLYMAGET